MIRFARLRLTATLGAALLMMAAAPAWAEESLQGILQASATQIETQLALPAAENAKVDAILQDGVKQRMAVLDKLGVKDGVKPSFSTLLTLKSDMDDIRTDEQKQLAAILSEQQMYTVEQVADQSETQFRAALLGK